MVNFECVCVCLYTSYIDTQYILLIERSATIKHTAIASRVIRASSATPSAPVDEPPADTTPVKDTGSTTTPDGMFENTFPQFF